jgi:trans-aconitate methyltransferase
MGAPVDATWVDVGCGTSVVTTAVLAHADASAVVRVDASPAFVHAAAERPDDRERLRAVPERRLPRDRDGSIPLVARAWAVRARRPV